MTELMQQQLIDPASQFGPLRVESVPLDRYLEGSVLERANPTPEPGQLSVESFAAPVVDLLTQAGPAEREEIIFELLDTYLRAADLPVSQGPMDASIAGRNLVADIVHSAQRWAFENNDVDLSSDMVWLACNLFREEMNRGGFAAAPALLHTVIYDAIGAQSRADGKMVAQEPELTSAEQWYKQEDTKTIQWLLTRFILADEFDYSQASAVDFVLSNWRLDPEAMKYAWSQGFSTESRPEEFRPDPAIRVNMHRIATVEDQDPGISWRLNLTKRIRSFARLSPKFMRHLDQSKPGSKTASGIYVAMADEYDSFNTPDQFDDLLAQAEAIGDFLDYYEFGSKAELKYLQTKFRYRYEQRRSVLISAHSNGYNIVADYNLPQDEGEYSAADMVAEKDHLRTVFAGIGRVGLIGCRSDVKGGLSDALTEVVRNMKVEGLTRIMGVRIEYTKEGFRLIHDESRSPAPAPAIPTAGVLERVTNPPRVRERNRLSNRQEMLLTIMDHILAAGHPYFIVNSPEDLEESRSLDIAA